MRSIQFHLFEIKRVLVYKSTIFKLTDLLFYTFSLKIIMTTKKYLRKNAKIIMCNWSNCDQKSQLSDILTEPLNLRGGYQPLLGAKTPLKIKAFTFQGGEG